MARGPLVLVLVCRVGKSKDPRAAPTVWRAANYSEVVHLLAALLNHLATRRSRASTLFGSVLIHELDCDDDCLESFSYFSRRSAFVRLPPTIPYA
jgi:hypothetical protein